MSDLSKQLRRRVAALCPDWDADGISGFLFLDGGYSNHNYRFTYEGERYVLRAPYRERADVNRRLEHHVYTSDGLTAMPELIAFDPRSGDMISRWVAGTLLADAHPDGNELTDYLKRLHADLPDVDRNYDPLEQALQQLQHAKAPRWVERLASAVTWEPDAPVTCHNDLNPWNLIRTPDGAWVTLDWEWVGRNDPLFDLVTLHQGGSLPAGELEPMARRYLGRAAEASRLQCCLTVFWLRETSWAMAELAAGNGRPEVAAQRALGLQRLAGLTF